MRPNRSTVRRSKWMINYETNFANGITFNAHKPIPTKSQTDCFIFGAIYMEISLGLKKKRCHKSSYFNFKFLNDCMPPNSVRTSNYASGGGECPSLSGIFKFSNDITNQLDVVWHMTYTGNCFIHYPESVQILYWFCTIVKRIPADVIWQTTSSWFFEFFFVSLMVFNNKLLRVYSMQLVVHQ